MFREVFTPDTRTAEQIDNNILTAGTTTANVKVQPGSILRLVNTHATQTLHINFGTVAVTAVVATDMIIPPAFKECFVHVPENAEYMAYIASGATTVFHMTRGK